MPLNHIVLEGNLTRDPEMRYSAAGQPITKISIATNEKSGGQEHVSYTDATGFGKTAEFLAANFTKGQRIIVEGRLRHERWEDGSGRPCQKHGILVDRVHFAGAAKRQDDRPAASAAHVDSRGSVAVDDEELAF